MSVREKPLRGTSADVRNPASSLAQAIVALLFLYALQVWAVNDCYRAGVADFRHAIVIIATGVLQSAALWLLYRALKRGARLHPSALILSVVVLLAASAIPMATSGDALAYIAYAKLPLFEAAYLPSVPSIAANGFEIVREYWPRLPALVYGPLWLLVDRLLLSHSPTLATSIVILRAWNALWLVALIVATARSGLDHATVTIIALNPMLYFYYIFQAHNDLPAIALVVIGAAIAVHRPLTGALVAGTSGLIKITFVLIATLAYRAPNRRTKLLQFLVCIGVTAAGSTLFGGSNYISAMLSVGHEQVSVRNDLLHNISLLLHSALALIAIVAIAFAALRGTFISFATYSFAAISSSLYPWYLGWCVPYALEVPTTASAFLILLPGIAHAIDPNYSLYPSHTFAVQDAYYLATIVLVVWQLTLLRRSHRSH